MEKSSAKEEFLSVGGEVTHVVKCGKVPTDILILIIPGNPGAAFFYEEFAEEIHANSNFKVPVWSISHAGHVTVPKEHHNGDTKHGFYTLKGQIQHKVKFVQEHIPKDVKLILLGHSIGSYIILHMLEEIGDRVLKCGLLFLTIERMAVAPKGIYMTPLMKYMRWAAPIIMYPFSWLPNWVHKTALRLYFRNRPIHPGSIKALLQLASSSSIRNVTNMANEEFQKVLTADYDLIEKHMNKLWFYYGSRDHWCPVEYYEAMSIKYPSADISLCKHGFEHAFCLEASKPMANIVWDFMSSNLSCLA